ncbi:unnamed protein product [Cercospora beticola]|nr:unnamed protein product [Cercospora beticola]
MSSLVATTDAIHILQVSAITALLLISGIAWGFSIFVLPLIRLPSNPSRSALDQFEKLVSRGGVTLQPASIICALVLAGAATLSWQSSDAEVATGPLSWRNSALACFVLLQVGWWEGVLITPLSAAIVDMKHSLPPKESWLRDREQLQFHNSLKLWNAYHIIRAALPLVAGIILLRAYIVESWT